MRWTYGVRWTCGVWWTWGAVDMGGTVGVWDAVDIWGAVDMWGAGAEDRESPSESGLNTSWLPRAPCSPSKKPLGRGAQLGPVPTALRAWPGSTPALAAPRRWVPMLSPWQGNTPALAALR